LARLRQFARRTVLVLVLPVALIPGAAETSEAAPFASPAPATSHAPAAVPEREPHRYDYPVQASSHRRSGGGPRSHRRAVPILMYHVIGNPRAEAPYPQLYISAKVLAGQMRYLDRRGYEVVLLQDVYDYWHGARLPRKPIVLSFDDGFATDATVARRILAAHEWAGTLNLALSHYGPSWGLRRRTVTALIRAGWEIDSHTRTHPDLRGLGAARLKSEIAGSRRFLRRTFHIPVNFLAYPSGAYDSVVAAAVRKSGYLGAMTTEDGLARCDELYRLHRIRVARSEGVTGVVAKLRRLG
jgi:peptidoglycan/xylan/chitin deacetylase (PgdA/CDA1 family)